MQQIIQTTHGRRYDIDAIRVLAFGILILYHLGMFYVAECGWHIKSQYQSDTLQLGMQLVNQWRMPLLFLVSGMASWFLLRKLGAGLFARNRLTRLLLPLAFGMLLIVPPQAYFEALATGAAQPGYLAFLARYFTFQSWPDGAFAGSQFGVTWNHLWYLPYLLCYSLVFAPVAAWLRSREAAVQRGLAKLNGPGLLLLPALPLAIYALALFPIFGGINHTLIDDGYAHALFFTFFVYGYLLVGNNTLWQTLGRMRQHLLWIAPLCFAMLITLREILPQERSSVQTLLEVAVICLNRWCWILLVLAWGHRLLNRPFRWLPYANEAVYPWYILHQTITIVAGAYLAQWSLGPVVEPALVLVATIGGCLLLHEYVIRRVQLLRPLFGLKPPEKTRMSATYQAISPG